MHRVRKPQTPKSDPPPDTPDTGATALKPYRHTTIQACTWSDKRSGYLLYLEDLCHAGLEEWRQVTVIGST